MKLIDIGTLNPHPDNPRKATDKQIAALKASIELGRKFLPKSQTMLSTITVNRNGMRVLGGHQRLKALMLAGVQQVSDEDITFIEVPPDSDEELAILVSLNNQESQGGWVKDDLKRILDDLAPRLKEDFAALAFDALGSESAGRNPGPADEGKDAEPKIDKAKELNKDWKVEPCDLWTIGPHRLLCGDSTQPESYARLMGAEKAALVVTDPPYGVDYAGKNKFLNAADKGNRVQTPIVNDDRTPDEMYGFWRSAWKAARSVMADNCSYYLTGPQGGDLLILLLSLRDEGWTLKHMLIWAKNNHVLGRCDYHYQHEPILYGWMKTHVWYGGHSQTSLWEIDRPLSSPDHPTTKPIALPAKAIQNSSKENDAVLDPFLGSGTTLIAAANLQRRCFGIEISPDYCAVILQRAKDALGLTGERIDGTKKCPPKKK